ncbi:hypothetical protein CEXT_639451 [Caerostris extrusa]|uniref:Uncharacterized protein n=1 Tax=Caerostris extrusa TaxID=172846 RepID=A0AAV4QSY4_CAEEX|nr:hypothetical protein CEXT_639451 [Caerostris extrusa]
MGHHQIKWQKSQHDFTRDNQQSARLATFEREEELPQLRIPVDLSPKMYVVNFFIFIFNFIISSAGGLLSNVPPPYFFEVLLQLSTFFTSVSSAKIIFHNVVDGGPVQYKGMKQSL